MEYDYLKAEDMVGYRIIQARETGKMRNLCRQSCKMH